MTEVPGPEDPAKVDVGAGERTPPAAEVRRSAAAEPDPGGQDPSEGQSTREILGNPRFPLKGSFKGDIDIAIDMDVDIDIALDDRGT